MTWRKKLTQFWRTAARLAPEQQPSVVVDGREIGLGDVYLATASETARRAEGAMPGTSSIPQILALLPPPIDPDLAPSAVADALRDFGPDPIAEYSLAAQARGVLSVGQLSAAITPELRRYFGLPMFYVRTPSGRITYMVSANAPKDAAGIVAGWTLQQENGDDDPVERIYSSAQGLTAWLGTRPEGFTVAEAKRAAIAAQYRVAQRIIAIQPNRVSIVAWPKEPAPRLDGRKVWRTLHALGLRWGNMDQFQWSDPTNQTDYLFWAEVDDGQFGYALPEEIAAGRQHFEEVRFTLDIARTPHPAHVLGQMTRAAEAFAGALDCRLTAMIDESDVDGTPALGAAVREVVDRLAACGLKPGCSSVCRLR